MSRIKIDHFKEEDIKDFIGLSSTEYKDEAITNKEHVRWKHVNSNFGPSIYVTLNNNKSVIGRVLLHRRVLQTKNKKIIFAQPMDLLIKKDFRRNPLNFIKLTKACDNIKESDYIFHTSNEKSYPLYKHLLKFSSPFKLSAYGFPINIGSILGALFKVKIEFLNIVFLPFYFLFFIIFYLANYFSNINFSKTQLNNRDIQSTLRRYKEKSWDCFDRSVHFLEWRFKNAPLREADIIQIKKNGDFAGYIVLKKASLNHLTHLTIMDFMLIPNLNILDRLVIKFWLINEGVKSKSDTLFLMVNPFSEASKPIIGFPFLPIPESLLPHATPIFIRAIKKRSKWLEFNNKIHITLADLDYF